MGKRKGLVSMIAGMNVLEFTFVAWIGCVALALVWDFGPEVYAEQKATWKSKHAKSEITVEMPVGSFDPDSTMKFPRVKKHEIPEVFIMTKRPASTGRHAKV